MILETNTGIKINTTETPQFNDYHGRFYVWGYRWIETKQRWSSSWILHNFKSFTVTSEE